MQHFSDTMTTMPKANIGGSKLRSYPEHFQAWLAGKNPGPLVVEAGVVNGCNHNCQHCDFQQFEPYGKHKGFLDPEVFKGFLQEFAAMGGVELFFAGDGEPMLHPQFCDFVLFAKKLGLNCTLSSNGQMFNRNNAEKLLPHLSWIRCSVNGGDPKTYGQVHVCGPQEYERLTRNLTEAVKIRDAGNYSARLSMQFILYDLNFDSVAGVVDLHQKVGTDLLIFRNRIDKDGSKNLVPQRILDQIRQIEAEHVNVEVRWSDFSGQPDTPTWNQCHGPNFRVYLDSAGNIVPCARDFYVDSKIGNINQQPFKEIWESQKRKGIYSDIAAGREIALCGKWCQVSFDNIYIQGWLDSHSPKVGSL